MMLKEYKDWINLIPANRQEKILIFICNHPGSYCSVISRHFNCPYPSALISIKFLLKHSFINYTTNGREKYYKVTNKGKNLCNYLLNLRS